MFWKGIEPFLATRDHLWTESMYSKCLVERATLYAKAIQDSSRAPNKFIGFIDGTVIGVSRPGKYVAQKVAYNGHKRKHALKYKAITTRGGLILYAFGPMEGRKHHWTLYMEGGLEKSCNNFS